MKIKKISFFILLFVISAFRISLNAQEDHDTIIKSNQLTEPSEVRANEVQPPELVMDILGIRQGMIIGKYRRLHFSVTNEDRTLLVYQ